MGLGFRFEFRVSGHQSFRNFYCNVRVLSSLEWDFGVLFCNSVGIVQGLETGCTEILEYGPYGMRTGF